MSARKTKSRQAAKKVKPWRLEAQMEFVKPHLFSQSDDQSSNIPPLPESPASVASSCHDLSLNDEELGNREAETPASSDRDTPSTSSENRTKTRKPTPSGTAAEMLRHYIDMKMSTNFPPASKIPSGDHLTKYFQSIEETVRTLPPHIQIRLKSQISQLVHNAELEAVSVNFSTPPSAYPLSPFPSSLSVQQSFPIPSANFYPTTSDNQPPPNQSNIPIQSAQSNNQSFSCPPPANYLLNIMVVCNNYYTIVTLIDVYKRQAYYLINVRPVLN